MENSMQVPAKTKNRATIWSRNPILGHISREKHGSKYICTLIFIAVLFAMTKIWKQFKCLLMDEWINNIWQIHTIEYYSATNKNRASFVAQMVKRLPTLRETRIESLGQEDPLEKEMATHSSTLAWKIPWTEEPSRLQSMGSQRVGHDWVTSLHFTNKNEKKKKPFTTTLVGLEIIILREVNETMRQISHGITYM